MSSPLSSLRKSKKTPLPRGNRMPFRPRPPAQLGGTGGDPEALDSATQREIIADLHRERRAEGRKAPSKRNAPSDAELLGSMATRLALVERELLAAKREIVEKDCYIRDLESRLSTLELSRGPDNPAHGGRVQELETICEALQNQVNEMEEFLNDYGMVWVGGAGGGQGGGADVWVPEESVVGGDSQVTINYDRIIKNTKELNVLAGEGSAEVVKSPQGGRLQPVESIPLILYKNGLVMFQGPFRPFTDPSTQQCVADLMDGYFPSELQARYPEGVPLKVTDKRDVVFQARCYGGMFPGSGHSIGGRKGPSKLLPSSWQEGEGEVTSELPGPKVSLQTFLSRLPASVVRGGRVVDVRSGVAEALQGGAHEVTLVDTPTLQEIKSRLDPGKTSRPHTPGHVTTLRVRSEDGQQAFVLKMKYSETIGDVRQHLDKRRPPDVSRDYLLKSTFPSRSFHDDSASLSGCGLVPSANLVIVPKPHPPS